MILKFDSLLRLKFKFYDWNKDKNNFLGKIVLFKLYTWKSNLIDSEISQINIFISIKVAVSNVPLYIDNLPQNFVLKSPIPTK